MRIQDKNRFQAAMASIGDVFTRVISPQTTDLFWNALKDLPIEDVENSVQSCVRHLKHFPKPADIRERSRELAQNAPTEIPQLPPLKGKWQRLADGMFLQYLANRRLNEQFRGDIALFERRQHTLQLVEFFQQLEAEQDPEATKQALQIRFDLLMARLPDAA